MNDNMVQVTGTPYVRDITSMGLSNTNMSEKEEYYAKRKLLQIQKEELNNIQGQINSLKSDMNDIKFLLNKLIENNG